MTFRLELATGPVPRLVPRPAVPGDAPRLVAMFERCSPASRYGRFLAPLHHFPAAHLVDVVRSSDVRRSWVIDDLRTGDVVAVGSWFRNQPETAELGLLVEDGWQHHQLGSMLLDALVASARHAGITRLVGHTLADARHVHRMLRRLGPTTIACSGTTCTMHVSLVDEADVDEADVDEAEALAG